MRCERTTLDEVVLRPQKMLLGNPNERDKKGDAGQNSRKRGLSSLAEERPLFHWKESERVAPSTTAETSSNRDSSDRTNGFPQRQSLSLVARRIGNYLHN